MHIKRASLARTILAVVGAAAAVLLLPGCGAIALTNLTAPDLPDNPSEIYTFTLRVAPRTNVVIPSSIAPHIVIGGQNYAMKQSGLPGIWEFDYQMPPGMTEVSYYYLVDYTVEGNGTQNSGQAYTQLERSAIVRRYVSALEATRGPVGASIGIVGRGFTPADQVNVGNQPVRSVFASPNAVSFIVPALPSGVYPVTISNSAGSSPVGSFRIDSSTVSADPASLTLTSGQSQDVSFNLSSPAPAGGLLLDFATDVPASVIMPEVTVPEGQTSVRVTIQGGQPGTGKIVLRGYGDGLSIPVTVSAR